MKNLVKLLLGVVAILPLLLFILTVVSIILWIQSPPKELIVWIFEHPFQLVFINLVLLVVSIAPLVFYIIHAGLNPGLADRKGVWVILMIFFGSIIMPIYWYQFIWHDGYYDAR